MVTSAPFSSIKKRIYSNDSADNLLTADETNVLPSSSLQFTSVEAKLSKVLTTPKWPF